MGKTIKKTMRKSIAFFLSFIMFTSVILNGNMIRNLYAEESVITRAEWLNKLVETFDMSMDENDSPDNYFSDINNETTYYDDIMKAVYYGIVDIEAGKEFKPNEAATREFAARTLNACLGYQLEDDTTYTFIDSSNCEYAEDDQIAVNKEWFALVNGKFMPDTQITTNEVQKMLNAVKTELKKLDVSADYDSVWQIADGVKEVPAYIQTTVDNAKVTITNSPVVINEDDIFVVYQGEIAVPFKAVSVSKTGNQTVITTAEIDDYDSAFNEVDAEGIIETEELTFKALDGTALEVETVDEPIVQNNNQYLATASGTRKIKDVKFSKSFNTSGNTSSSISGTFSNITVKYEVLTGSKEAFVQVEGDLNLKGSIEAALDKSINIMEIGIPGIGSVILTADINAAGKINTTVTTHILTGISYSKSDGFRTIRSFKENGGSNTSVEGTASLGATLKCGITELKVISGYVYGKAGITAKVEDTAWTTGEPRNCKTFVAYMYASYGAEASCKLVNYKYSKKIDIYTLDNSPLRVYHHYEDGKPVGECTRGLTFDYFTKYYSSYWNSGWAGCDSSYGLDDTGKPYAIYEYEVKEDSSKNEYAVITKYKGNMRTLTVPETLDGYEVRVIGNNAFEGNQYIRVLDIPDCITEINESAFSGCSNLSDVKLSKGLTKMGGYAFGDCDALTSICIPKSLKETTLYNYRLSYFYGVFRDSDNLKNITFEEGTTEIACGLFANNSSIESIEIPDTVTKIGDNAFENCTNLKNIKLSSSLTTIGDNVFYNASKLEKIEIPDTVTGIGVKCFYNCTSLSDVKLPDKRVNITEYMFYGCKNLKTITLPDTVEYIRRSAFEASGLESIKMSPNVITIEQDAFKDTNLEQIEFSGKEESIGNNAFKNCDSLESISIPDSVTSIGSGIFQDCDKLKEVKLGTGITSIPANAFEHCDVLESIVIPYKVTTIKDSAFANSTKFTEITIPRATSEISSTAFSYPTRMTVYGITGTYAETYAGEKEMNFVNKEVNASKVVLNCSKLSININDTTALTINVEPINFTDEVDWKSTDTSIVTVDKNGNIKAVGIGSATIKVTVGNLSATCEVTVVQPVKYITLNTYNLELESGDTYQLTANVSPSSANNQKIVWSSSDSQIVTVDQNGKIDAIGKGKATITATAEDGSGVKKECTVNVINNSYMVTEVSEMESSHPYTNNCKDIWVYSIKGANALEIIFDEKTEIEDGFDNLILLDGSNKQIGIYTGKQLSGKKIIVTGDTVKIKLDTDNGGTAYGFKVSSITATNQESPILGDVNGDEIVDIKDSALLKRYLAGWEVDIDLTAADMDGDGNVTIKDSALLKRQLAGW